MEGLNSNKIGCIIQARTGATRLPRKVILPFFNGDSILDIMIKKLKKLPYPVVLATSDNPDDEILKNTAIKHEIQFFQGDEQNVLKRFINAADYFGLNVILRVCADNPFLEIQYAEQLISSYLQNPSGYTAFFTAEDLPVIKTHYGFFPELVELAALEKVAAENPGSFYLEHVTNYIYSYPQKFTIKKLPLPFAGNPRIRLTIDTQKDFQFASDMYAKYHLLSANQLVQELQQQEQLLDKMQTEILRNQK